MPILDEPTFPVIDSAPNLMTAIRNFRRSDYLTWAGLAIPAFPIGYFYGSYTPLPKQHMYFYGAIGVFGGFCYAYQSSVGRLLGLRPNDIEVEANGLKRPEPLLDT